MTMPCPKSLLSFAIAAALLSGCGGGGGGGSSTANGSQLSTSGSSNSTGSSATDTIPAAPTAVVGFALKQLQFSWAAVSGATSYRVLEDANGSGNYSPISGDITATAFNKDIAVHTQNWAAARYQIQACNNAGCSTSAAVAANTEILKTIGYFKASNTSAGDSFGWTLALSGDGNTLAVGAPFEDSAAVGINQTQADENATDSGAVYVFVKSSGGWIQQAYVKASNTLTAANFGESLALSNNGNVLVVGAPFEDSAATTINGNQTEHSAADAGAVYVFARSNSNWTQQTYIKPSNTHASSYFGWSVGVSDDGNTVVSGAPGESNNATGVNPSAAAYTAANTGAAYVFNRASSSASWSQKAYLKASNAEADDNFGTAVALSGSGSTLAVGAPYEASKVINGAGVPSDNSQAKAGAVYVFVLDGNWTQMSFLKASNAGAQDNFGAALALNDAGDTLAVGAPYEASSASGLAGDQTNNAASAAGAVYVFARAGASWSQQQYVKASNTNSNDDFGSAVALSSDGNVLAVGAIGESSNATGVGGIDSDNSKDGAGAAYVFKRSGVAWQQINYLKPTATAVGIEFGTALGLSADAGTLAVSGGFEASDGTGINSATAPNAAATDAGALWLF
ncbi:MAG: sensor signal transduction histidine kinase [Verrucomicrobiaceae bacterium]|nr:sensor signal transduction histidine kinase [Verrucomicrobiaceae bacterium]